MNKQLARKWVEALRSGKYEQGTDRLKRNGKYCCLGVLCEISGLESAEVDDDNGDIETVFLYGITSSGICLPAEFASDINLSAAGYLNKLEVHLTDLNDNGDDRTEPLTFDEIADVIQIYFIEGL